MRARVLEIDGLNVIIGLEGAVAGGVLLRGADGVLRDLAGLRGSYRPVEATDRALELFAGLSAELRPACAHFFLDAPVSNSGRLRARILDHAARFECAVKVDLVQNPDRELAGRDLVVSSDSVVIDSARTWVNLLDYAVRKYLPNAVIADLGALD